MLIAGLVKGMDSAQNRLVALAKQFRDLATFVEEKNELPDPEQARIRVWQMYDIINGNAALSDSVNVYRAFLLEVIQATGAQGRIYASICAILFGCMEIWLMHRADRDAIVTILNLDLRKGEICNETIWAKVSAISQMMEKRCGQCKDRKRK